MSKLIPNDTALRIYIPQQVVAVKGETSLFDKMAHWLDSAEQWLENTFTSAPTLTRIAGYSDDHPLKRAARSVVAHEALTNAIPSLDLVQTLNGFAVVSNANLAPASKERVERLIASHRSLRDSSIDLMMPLLAEASQWKGSAQCSFFASTLFQRIADIRILSKEPTWEKFIELRPAILAAESRLASEYISHELMQSLRDMALGLKPNDAIRARLKATLQSHVADLVCDRPLRDSNLRDIVDYIRRHADDFPEWHRSDVARLFDPPVFENKKKASGYFF